MGLGSERERCVQHTSLDTSPLLLIGDELAELGLVLVVELVEVGLVEGDGVHFGRIGASFVVFLWEKDDGCLGVIWLEGELGVGCLGKATGCLCCSRAVTFF
jgi:hypothetical protein